MVKKGLVKVFKILIYVPGVRLNSYIIYTYILSETQSCLKCLLALLGGLRDTGKTPVLRILSGVEQTLLQNP